MSMLDVSTFDVLSVKNFSISAEDTHIIYIFAARKRDVIFGCQGGKDAGFFSQNQPNKILKYYCFFKKNNTFATRFGKSLFKH